MPGFFVVGGAFNAGEAVVNDREVKAERAQLTGDEAAEFAVVVDHQDPGAAGGGGGRGHGCDAMR